MPQKHAGVKKGRKSANFVWIEVEKKYINNLKQNVIIVATYINDITFYGRTGEVDDNYREQPLPLGQTIPIPNILNNLPTRRNCDSIVNLHGSKLIHLYHTFHSPNHRASTIDYSLCTKNLFDYIDNFLVLPITEIFDHSKIVTVFNNSALVNDIPAKDSYKWKPLGTRFT